MSGETTPPADEAAQHPLGSRPQPCGLDEGLVVEAGGEEPADEPGWPPSRRTAATARCSGSCTSMPALDAPVGAADVGLVADLHHAAWVEEARREQPARAVVLEAAREDPLARRGQRRGDGVARVSRGTSSPFQRERERARRGRSPRRAAVQAHGQAVSYGCVVSRASAVAAHPPVALLLAARPASGSREVPLVGHCVPLDRRSTAGSRPGGTSVSVVQPPGCCPQVEVGPPLLGRRSSSGSGRARDLADVAELRRRCVARTTDTAAGSWHFPASVADGRRALLARPGALRRTGRGRRER